jgi:hypothetical protein
MTVITEDKVADWFQGPTWQGPEHVNFDGKKLLFTHSEAACIELKYPARLDGIPFFARAIATLGHKAEEFEGARILFTQWGLWNFEATGYRIIERMNAGAGQPASFEAVPGFHFRADELDDAIGTLLQPVIFGWDAFYVPSWWSGDDYFLHVSHDGFIVVVTRTKEFHELALKSLEECKLEASPVGDKWPTKHFCRGG